jgi:protein gp37
MGDKTGIEWTDATWNPTTGCDQVSPGCDNCYALTLAARLKGMGVAAYQNDGDPRTSGPGFKLTLHPDRLDQPLRWKRPRRVFVNSMSDLFHPDVPDEFIGQVWQIMWEADQHIFQILTKRPQRMASFFGSVAKSETGWQTHNGDNPGAYGGSGIVLQETFPYPHVWLGTSIESDKYTFRANHLRSTPAAVRFLSLEPLLGPLPSLDLTDIDWVIVGGESGSAARPMHPDWVRDLRDRCVEAGVAFFFKQWGAWSPVFADGGAVRNHKLSKNRFAYDSIRFQPDGHVYRADEPDTYSAPGMTSLIRVGKKAAGRELDGRIWDEMPATEVPA